jgi:hypothetical protein
MSDLNDLVEPLKRELAVPGEFDTIFPNTDDGGLVASLADGFAEAQLDGFFPDYVVDLDTYLVTPDLSNGGAYLVVIYAGMRTIRAQLRALNTVERYAAGPAQYEIQKSSSVLKAELDYLKTRKDDLVTKAASSSSEVTQYDGYFTRSATDWQNATGLWPAELGW